MTARPLLLVEDDPNSVTFFQYALTTVKVAHTLQVAADGQEAIEYLEGLGKFADRQAYPMPGLVLLDLRMPRATGFEVLERIRKNFGTGSLPIVVFTGSANAADIAKAYALGANGYLVKPTQLEELVTIVRAINDFWLTHNYPPPAPRPAG